MRKSNTLNCILACAAGLVMAMPTGAQATGTVFDDFNVDEGHFNLQPTFSGSTAGILTTSTADRVTVAPREGDGCEQLVLYTNGAASVRVRFLSGGGSPSANLAFTTSAGADGWIGFYLKTTNTAWTAQLWIEGASVNGGIPKDVVADGQWHLYEWDLDDNTGDTNGWGDISGVISGSATVADGSHTIDSIVLRNATVPDGTNTIFLDFVARNDSGSVSNLLEDPCHNTSGVLVSGPVSTNSNQVTVIGVADTATQLTVYQDSGTGMVPIGSKTTGITAGNNTVTVSGLIKTAVVAATQTVNGQESCVPTTGIVVGGGANPPLRLALSIKENPTATGPVGADGATGATGIIDFIPCSSTLPGSCPGDGTITITPGTGWQTVTVTGREGIADSANVAGTPAPFVGVGYAASDSVTIQVYAYKILPLSGVTVYSETGAQSSAVTSNDVFTVNWTWDAVPGADGYRLLRDLNGSGYNEVLDVYGINNVSDANSAWSPDNTVTPKKGQVLPSVPWFGAGTANNIAGDWGILESIALVSADPNDTGPYRIYIDDLANGSHGVFQDFEGFPSGTIAGAVFNQPSYSGTTSGNILGVPNDASIVSDAAYSGTKSQRVEWQFVADGTNQWMRFNTYNTSAMPNPLVDLNEPISFRILVEPVGSTPTPPPAPTLSVSLVNGKAVINWTGAHNLQTSVNVSGAYTNVPSVTLAPYTNNFTEPVRFFRLAN